MARKSKNTKEQANSADQEPEPTATHEEPGDPNPAPKGRTPGGQFAAGNAGGPGNPHARHCARMLQAFRENITEDEMLQICRMLFVKAVGGDVSAAKIILSYKIGKPLPAPHPDSIDRDEWDHYQNDAIRAEEMKLAMSSLPTHAGNDILRASLPIMTASRMNDFAAQLIKTDEGGRTKKKDEGGGTKKKDEGGGMKDEGNLKKGEPIANGKTGRGNAERGRESAEHGTRTNTSESPLPNGKLNEQARQTSTRKEPIANGKKNRKPGRESAVRTAPVAGTPAAGRTRGDNPKKKVRPAWMQPLAAQLQGN